MKIRLFLLFCLAMVIVPTHAKNISQDSILPVNSRTLASPDGRMEATFYLLNGIPHYALSRDEKPVILGSRMGFELEWRDDLAHAFVLKDVQRSTFDEVWHPVWGEEANIRNHYNEMLVTLEQPVGSVESMDHSTEKRPTIMQIRFRLYDDGLAFRYEFPMRYNGIDNALVCFWFKEELTSFHLTGNHTAWWIPGDYDTQEYNYTESRLSQIDSLYEKGHEHGGWPWTDFSRTGVQTALQMRTDDGLYINIHEAATLDFPTMHLNLGDNYTFRAWLCPDAAGYKGRMQAPCHTPWRSIMVCDKATDALRSRLILNLNEPCALEDVSWIHPVKYMGVWWEMISGKSTWSYTNDFPSVKLNPEPGTQTIKQSPILPMPNPTATTVPTTPTCAATSTSPPSTVSTRFSSRAGTSAGKTGTASRKTLSSTSSPPTPISTCLPLTSMPTRKASVSSCTTRAAPPR